MIMINYEPKVTFVSALKLDHCEYVGMHTTSYRSAQFFFKLTIGVWHFKNISICSEKQSVIFQQPSSN